MKKILALVLALMMVLFAVSAVAANSKQNNNISNAEVEDSPVDLEKAEDTEETKAVKDAITEANEAGDPTTGLPEDIQGQLPEGFKAINEMDTYKLAGELGDDDPVRLVFTFQTPYEKGQKVPLAVAVCPPEKETFWLFWNGTGIEGGDVETWVAKADLEKIGESPFVVIPVSE